MGIRVLAAACAAALATAATFGGTASAGPVYDGQTVILIVPNSPAGLMSQYARTIAPHLARHLGAADVRVENHQGAGGLKGANLLWQADPDGMTIAFTNVPSLIMAQLAGSPGVQFDVAKFTYLGRVAAEPRVLTVGAVSEIKGIADIKALGRPFSYASQGTDEDFYATAVLADSLGFPLKIVTGYEGNADTALAVIKGDVDGQTTGWIASKGAVQAGEKRVVLFFGEERLAELPDVPAAMELVEDPERKRVLGAAIDILEMSRGFFGPPEMDGAATAEMRAAVAATLADPALIEEAKKAGLDLSFEDGADQQQAVTQALAAGEALGAVMKAAVESIR
jgi:tripartite-type tricarboxylate transporter receptor subunit TctC